MSSRALAMYADVSLMAKLRVAVARHENTSFDNNLSVA